MKKLILISLIAVVLFSSCKMEADAFLWNNLDRDVTVTIAYEDGTTKVYEIVANSEIRGFAYDNIKSITYDGMDNSSKIVKHSIKDFSITPVEPKSITIRVSLPANAFGAEKIYISEEKGKMGKVYAPLELTEGLIKTVECYGSSKLYLSDAEGNPKTTFNGYPVLMIETDDNLMVIL